MPPQASTNQAVLVKALSLADKTLVAAHAAGTWPTVADWWAWGLVTTGQGHYYRCFGERSWVT